MILFYTGAQLALGACDFSVIKGEQFTTLVTAAFCIWYGAIGFDVGMIGTSINKRGLLKL